MTSANSSYAQGERYPQVVAYAQVGVDSRARQFGMLGGMEPHFLLRRDAVALGYTDLDLLRMCRSGSYVRLRRGVYADSHDLTGLSDTAKHLLAVRATTAAMLPDAAVSHLSASVVQEVPVWNVDLSRVHVTRSGSSGRRTRELHLHSAALADERVRTVGGLRITEPARTIVDNARVLEPERAVVIGDATIRKFALSDQALAGALEEGKGRYGIGKARRVVGLLDGRSESVGESRSRYAMLLHGVPMPKLQVDVFSDGGERLARVDFLWERFGVIGEFDGKGKYADYLAPGQTPGDVVLAERRREERLVAAGWIVVRWTWDDLADPMRFIRKLRAAFASGRPKPSPSRLAEVTDRFAGHPESSG